MHEGLTLLLFLTQMVLAMPKAMVVAALSMVLVVLAKDARQGSLERAPLHLFLPVRALTGKTKMPATISDNLASSQKDSSLAHENCNNSSASGA